jgi:hypothetical protein
LLLHFGSTHPIETALILLVAIGPFVGLGIVVFVIRRRDAFEEEAQDGDKDRAPPQR